MYKFMREAVDLALLGKGRTAPNPCVGALVIYQDRVVGRGWHVAHGRNHAEVEAIRDAGERGIDLSRCTLVVTLEPCNHHGKTPPCTQAILDAGITRVVAGVTDPHPQVAGNGLEYLREKGVRVELCDPEGICSDLIADFRHWTQTDTPYTYLKLACTLDGKIATRTGDSRWITGAPAREEVHELRSRVGAVIVGGNTFRFDDPGLDSRNQSADTPQPLAVVVTSHLAAKDTNAQLVNRRARQTIFWTHSGQCQSAEAEDLSKRGCRIWDLTTERKGIDLQKGLKRLRSELDIHYCLCEGGGRLANSLVQDSLAQEIWLFQATRILGDEQGKTNFTGNKRPDMDSTDNLRLASCSRLGDDLLLQLFPRD